jgi:hypothetical protein
MYVSQNHMKSTVVLLHSIIACWRKIRMQKNCGASVGNMWLCVTGEISINWLSTYHPVDARD